MIKTNLDAYVMNSTIFIRFQEVVYGTVIAQRMKQLKTIISTNKRQLV